MLRIQIPARTLLSVIVPLILAGCAHTGYNAQAPVTSNHTAHRIFQSLPKYAQLTREPWPQIHAKSLPLKKGSSGQSVAEIRQRLAKLGDLHGNLDQNISIYDAQLTQAVKEFQWRHGLKADGEVGSKTLEALNVSPQQRLAQLEKSMNKWAAIPENEGSHYIMVNTAGYYMNVVKDGKKVLDMKVVVGKPSRETPEIYSKLETIVLNPSWNIPYKIMKKDVIPKIVEDPNYLSTENISVYSSWQQGASKVDPANVDWAKAAEQGVSYKMTQAPGDHNALGRVKFVFNNSHDVYMHDTPHKELFDEAQRVFSSGCIRLHHPFRLVEYFIQENQNLEPEKVYSQLESGQTKYLRLKNPIPIYVTYITAWVDKEGRPHFREDVYGREHAHHNNSNDNNGQYGLN